MPKPYLVELRHHRAFLSLESYKQIDINRGTAVAVDYLDIITDKPIPIPNITDYLFFKVKSSSHYDFTKDVRGFARVNGWCNKIIGPYNPGIKGKLLEEIKND